MHFREAVQADYEDICKLVPNEHELYLVYPRGTHPFTVDQVRHLAELRKELTVATDGARIVGFANLYDFKDKEKAFIGNVVVEKSSRGRGLGKQLIGHMLNAAFSKYGLSRVGWARFCAHAGATITNIRVGTIRLCPPYPAHPESYAATIHPLLTYHY
ncbi:MAG: GNAT family N-acetyltransferase [Gammaproteobacteria bacterium]|nr:GNAT family N-acetyltransferase [Gammaproteobacteria bacterium]